MAQTASTSLPTGTPADRSVGPSSMSLTFGGFLRNKVINGNFDLAQRATSFSAPNNGAYTLDRWLVSYDGTISTFIVSQQAFAAGQTDVPFEPTSFLRWNQTGAGSGSAYRRFEHRVEDVRTLGGRTATFTLWAKADSSRNVALDLVQNFGSGGSADVVTTGATLALTSSWQKFTVTVGVPSISGKTLGAGSFLSLRFSLPINTTMTIDFAQAQLEEGSSATSFEQRPIGLETILAERYYQICPTYVPTTPALLSIQVKTAMRTTPTITGGGAGFTSSNLTANGGTCLQTAAAFATLLLDAEL